MLFTNRDHFISSFSIVLYGIYFHSLIALARKSEQGQPCLVDDLIGKHLISALGKMLAVGFVDALFQVEEVPYS